MGNKILNFCNWFYVWFWAILALNAIFNFIPWMISNTTYFCACALSSLCFLHFAICHNKD